MWGKYKEHGEQWVEDILLLPGFEWTAESYANLALALPASPALWKRVDQWGPDADRLYWTYVERHTNFEEHWVNVLAKWKEVSRPWSSLELVAQLVGERAAKGTIPIPTAEQVMDVLEQALRGESVESHHQQGSMLSYYVEQLFCFLDTQAADVVRMAPLEWGWFRILEHTKRGVKVLQKQITSSPELFVDLLKIVFRAEGEPKHAVTEEERTRAEQAYHVLHEIHSLPGSISDDNAALDGAALRSWVMETRRLAMEARRLGICDDRIGKILSYAPASPDGSWPCIEVRDLIEEIQSPEVEDGFRAGKYNQRGVIMRGKGGGQEWELATKYHTFADQVRTRWPRTAAILDCLARGYEGEAKDWDERAKRDEYE